MGGDKGRFLGRSHTGGLGTDQTRPSGTCADRELLVRDGTGWSGWGSGINMVGSSCLKKRWI